MTAALIQLQHTAKSPRSQQQYQINNKQPGNGNVPRSLISSPALSAEKNKGTNNGNHLVH